MLFHIIMVEINFLAVRDDKRSKDIKYGSGTICTHLLDETINLPGKIIISNSGTDMQASENSK